MVAFEDEAAETLQVPDQTEPETSFRHRETERPYFVTRANRAFQRAGALLRPDFGVLGVLISPTLVVMELGEILSGRLFYHLQILATPGRPVSTIYLLPGIMYAGSDALLNRAHHRFKML